MQLPFSSAVAWTALVCGVGYVLFVFLRFYFDFRRRSKFIHRLPGVPPHWFWGHLKEFPGPCEAGLTYMKVKTSESKSGLLRLFFGPIHSNLGVFHPNSVKAILKTSEPKPRAIGGYFNLEPWLGDGLLLSGGQKWSRNRRLLTPAFHFDILRPYMAINNRCVDVFLDKVEKFAESGEYFEVFTQVSLLTLDIILRCAFSYENDCQTRGKNHPYVQSVNSLATLATQRFLSPWLYPDFIFRLTPGGRQFYKDCDFVHKVSEEIIAKRKEVLGKQVLETAAKSRYLDFLDILLTARDDNGRGLTDREIRDEADTFMFEGHDTTSSGISWTLFSLASHPEAQARCQEEIDEILRGRKTKDIEWDDLPKLKYVTMCLKEALRLHTPVPVIERLTTKDMDIEGYHIPAGTTIDIHLYVLHHSAYVWEDPEEFRPERFSPENQAQTDPHAFLPFSAGPRNCIGQNFAMHEMKVAVARTLSRFTLTLDPKRPVKHQIVVVMKTENGMYMKATRRETPAAASA